MIEMATLATQVAVSLGCRVVVEIDDPLNPTCINLFAEKV